MNVGPISKYFSVCVHLPHCHCTPPLHIFSKLMGDLRSIANYARKCLGKDKAKGGYIKSLYNGSTQVIADLCKKGPFQTGNSYSN